jgi:hypothetical protein
MHKMDWVMGVCRAKHAWAWCVLLLRMYKSSPSTEGIDSLVMAIMWHRINTFETLHSSRLLIQCHVLGAVSQCTLHYDMILGRP